jgi:hypothetical protein
MKLDRSFWRFISGSLVLLTTSNPASATRPLIQITTSTLTVAEKHGNITLPIGTEVERSGSDIHAATLRKNLTYCQIKFQSGTRLEFGTGNVGEILMYSAQLPASYKLKGITLPEGTEVRFIDNSCNIDSFITHSSDIDFGYAKLNGWITLYPNGQVKSAYTKNAINVRGISAVGQLKFWQNGRLQEFYSGKSQSIKSIPIQSDVCVQLDRQGNPINFVLDKPYQFTYGKFQINDRIRLDTDGKVSLTPRSNNGRSKTNC